MARITMDPDGLIEAVYDAATEPALWPDVLDALAEAGRSLCATYSIWDKKRDRKLALSEASRQYYAPPEYHSHYGPIDPRRKLAQEWPAGTIYRCHEHLDEAFVAQSNFFQEYALKYDKRYLMSAHLLKTDEISSFLVLHRTKQQGPFDDERSRILEMLAPHLRRAAQIHMRFNRVEAACRSANAALDQLNFGVLVMAEDGMVVSLNSAAEEAVQAADGLSIRHARLVAANHSTAEKLSSALRQATVGGDQGVRRGTGLLIERPSGKPAYRVLVTPLHETRRSSFGSSGRPQAMVFITDPACKSGLPGAHLSSLFDLTPAEVQITRALLENCSLETIARMRGVAIGTVRTQVKAIFAKTGTHRQAELVALLGPLAVLSGNSRNDPGREPMDDGQSPRPDRPGSIVR